MKKAYTTKNGAEVRITKENLTIDDCLEGRLENCIINLAHEGYRSIDISIYKDQKERVCYSIKAKKGTRVLEIDSTYFSRNVNLTSVHYGTGELSAGERARLLAGPSHEKFKKRVKNL